MNFLLECKKMRRTGFFPAFWCGSILASLIPVLNMAVRSENYIHLPGTSVQILTDANWQMIAMLNLLMLAIGSCILYHTEYTDNAMQKLNTLPAKEERFFFGKVLLLTLMNLLLLTLEMIALMCCSLYWFDSSRFNWSELLSNFGYELLLSLPVVVLTLLVSCAFKNMWSSLGIHILCIFLATMTPSGNFAVSLFPYALPFQNFSGTESAAVTHYMIAAISELSVSSFAAIILFKTRRALR